MSVPWVSPVDVAPTASHSIHPWGQDHSGTCLPEWPFLAEEINSPGDLFTFYFYFWARCINFQNKQKRGLLVYIPFWVFTPDLYTPLGQPTWSTPGSRDLGRQEACCGPV